MPAIFGNKTSGVGLGTKSAFGSQPPGPTLLLLHTLYLTILSPGYTNPGTVRQTQVLHLYRLFAWFFPPFSIVNQNTDLWDGNFKESTQKELLLNNPQA